MFILVSLLIAAIRVWREYGEFQALILLNIGLICLLCWIHRAEGEMATETNTSTTPNQPSSSTTTTTTITTTKNEKEIQNQILSICRGRIFTENKLVDELMSISDKYELNVIHACTIVHKLSSLKSWHPTDDIRPSWDRFVLQSISLIAGEKSQLKSATSLAGCLGKLGDTRSIASAFEIFLTENKSAISDDDSLICQVLHVHNQLSSHPEKYIVDLIKSLKSLKQSEFVWFLTVGKKKYLPILLEAFGRPIDVLRLVGSFDLIGLSVVVSYARTGNDVTDMMEYIKTNMMSSLDFYACPVGDLLVGEFIYPNDPLIGKVISERFMELSPSFITSKFLRSNCGSFSLDYKVLKETVLAYVVRDELETIDAKRLYLSLTILHSAGKIVLRDFEFMTRLSAICKIFGNEDLCTFYLVMYGFDESVWSTLKEKIKNPLRLLDMANLLEVPHDATNISDGTESKDSRLVLSLKAGARAGGNPCPSGVRLTIEKFIPKNYVDAVNWCLVADKKHHEKVHSILRSANPLECESWIVVTLRAIRAGSILTGAVRAVIENTLTRNILMLSIDHLLVFLLHVKGETGVNACANRVDQLIREDQHHMGTAHVSRLVRILSERQLESAVNDKLFQGIQSWLVPRIGKLNLSEIMEVTSAIEMFGMNGSASTCADTESACDDIMTPVCLTVAEKDEVLYT